jgi:PhnB protein
MKRTNTYLIFDGNCRQAMKFYKECLGGELQLLPFSAMPPGVPYAKEAKDRIMHAKLSKGDTVVLMAIRIWAGRARSPCRWKRPSGRSDSRC